MSQQGFVSTEHYSNNKVRICFEVSGQNKDVIHK